jgi:hypothetical protein
MTLQAGCENAASQSGADNDDVRMIGHDPPTRDDLFADHEDVAIVRTKARE